MKESKTQVTKGNKMKTRIGEVEAFEICEERAIKNLPNLGTEVITVLSYGEKHLTGKADEVIGKDKDGFYLREWATKR